MKKIEALASGSRVSKWAASAVAAATFFISTSSFATILPENDLYLEDVPSLTLGIEKEQFEAIIQKVSAYYAPIVAKHGATLNIKNNWDNSTVNAYALQNGNEWIVEMFGGFARRPEVTPDAFVLTICHELGHHLGGFAFKTSFFSNAWAASEGQSDYFATHVCAKRIWKDDLEENAKAAATVAPVAKEGCDKAYSTTAEQNLCYRTANGGLALATLLRNLSSSDTTSPPTVDFSTPDTSVVTQNNSAHPKAQCRLDTYFQGALCSVAFDDDKIPGKDHPSGQASEDAERDAAAVSCTAFSHQTVGLRPACWFKARL